MSLGSQVKKYRQKFGMTQDQLASAAGMPIGTLGMLENRNSRSSKYAADIAKALGLTLDQLLDESTDYERDENIAPPTPPQGKFPPPLPVLTLPEGIDGKGTPIDYVWSAYPHNDDSFAIRFDYDALIDLERKNVIRKGCIVAFDPKKTPANDDYVLVSSTKHPEMAAVKTYRPQNFQEFLYSPNPGIPEQNRWLPIDDTISIHGVVIEIMTIPRKD